MSKTVVSSSKSICWLANSLIGHFVRKQEDHLGPQRHSYGTSLWR